MANSLSISFPSLDSHTGPQHDSSGSVEAKSVPYSLSAAGLQTPNHVSSLHGGE